MIAFDNCKIEFSGMGLFLSDSEWIHPKRTECTYEIIYVVSGEVHIKEADTCYSLTKGNLIILKPGICHSGFKTSHGRTSFYWLHFSCDNFDAFPIHTGSEIITLLFTDSKTHRIFKNVYQRCISEGDAYKGLANIVLFTVLGEKYYMNVIRDENDYIKFRIH